MAPQRIFRAHIELGRWLLPITIIIGVIALLLAGFSSAHASQDERIRINAVTQGSLLLESEQPGHFIQAPLLATDVNISISGAIGRTRVTQRFENQSDDWVEATYVFPLPDQAAVDTLKMQIGARFIEGEIEERQKARALYEAAKEAGKKATLLEQQRPNIFTNSVANIAPGETVVVQIEYQEDIRAVDGKFSIRFPLVVAPRYSPPPQILQDVSFDGATGWGVVDPVPDRAAISAPVLKPEDGLSNPVSVTVDLDAGFPLGSLETGPHSMVRDDRGPSHAVLTLVDETVPADRDFTLTWTPKTGQTPSAGLFQETVNGQPYYLLMVTPPTQLSAAAIPARDVTFVIDTSGSMKGQSIAQAKASLALAVSRLKQGDRFNVVQFNSSLEMLFEGSQPVNERTIGTALGYIRGLSAQGGTNMLPALMAALTRDAPTGRLEQVIFLTDGAIGNEQALFDAIAQGRGEARIFTIGIGSAPNSYFMRRAAELGQGTFTHIGSISDVQADMTALLQKLERPAVTDISVSWPEDAETLEAWPNPVPDIYAGETLLLAAKVSSGQGALRVSGQSAGAGWQADIPLSQAVTRPGIAKLWARKKIASLESLRSFRGADFAALDEALLDTALTHGLVSRLTSLVAVDKTPSRPQEDPLETRDLPLNLPAGWDFDAVFGSEGQPAFEKRAMNRSGASGLAFAAAPQAAQSIALPRTAGLWSLKLLKGLFIFGLALVGALLLREKPSAHDPR